MFFYKQVQILGRPWIVAWFLPLFQAQGCLAVLFVVILTRLVHRYSKT